MHLLDVHAREPAKLIFVLGPALFHARRPDLRCDDRGSRRSSSAAAGERSACPYIGDGVAEARAGGERRIEDRPGQALVAAKVSQVPSPTTGPSLRSSIKPRPCRATSPAAKAHMKKHGSSSAFDPCAPSGAVRSPHAIPPRRPPRAAPASPARRAPAATRSSRRRGRGRGSRARGARRRGGVPACPPPTCARRGSADRRAPSRCWRRPQRRSRRDRGVPVPTIPGPIERMTTSNPCVAHQASRGGVTVRRRPCRATLRRLPPRARSRRASACVPCPRERPAARLAAARTCAMRRPRPRGASRTGASWALARMEQQTTGMPLRVSPVPVLLDACRRLDRRVRKRHHVGAVLTGGVEPARQVCVEDVEAARAELELPGLDVDDDLVADIDRPGRAGTRSPAPRRPRAGSGSSVLSLMPVTVPRLRLSTLRVLE